MYKKEISDYIEAHENEMIEDIKTLCSIDSSKTGKDGNAPFGKGPLEALESALSIAQKYGFITKNYDNYAGAIDMNTKEHQLDMLAHLDVVPAQEGWTETEAFNPVVKLDRIYGRGTSDDKGPAVAALYAMRAIKELNIPLKKNARLILGTDEENGSDCIKHYYETEKEAPMTFSPDGDFPVVNIEKGRLPGEFSAKWEKVTKEPALLKVTGGKIENAVPPRAEAEITGLEEPDIEDIAHEVTALTGVKFSFEKDDNGVLHITSSGVNAHAAEPQNGKNALTALIQLLIKLPFAPCSAINILSGLYALMPYGETDGAHLGIKVEDGESGALTLTFSMMQLDENGMKGLFDCRYPILADRNMILKNCTEKFAAAGMEFDGSRMIAPHHVPSDSAFVKELLKCYEEYTGLEGKCTSMGGGTYVHDLKNGVAFGAVFPGTDTRMHAPDEFAVIPQLKISAKIFAQVIADICG